MTEPVSPDDSLDSTLPLWLRQRQFEHLVRSFQADVYRFAYWLCQQPSVADDLTQETFLRAWKAMDQLQDVHKARSWLFTIVRRENARRFERKSLDIESEIDQDLLPAPQPESIEWQLTKQRLPELIAALPVEYREPLVLQILFGMTSEEIAELMQMNLNTINTRLYRGRQQLLRQCHTTEVNHG